MGGEGRRTLFECRRRGRWLRERGFSYDQIVDVLALDHTVSPLRLYRFAHGRTAKQVCDEFNQLDPAASAGIREARLYDYETWPDVGRRPPAWALALLGRIYRTRTRSLITDAVYATYRPKDQDTIDGSDHRHLDTNQRLNTNQQQTVTNPTPPPHVSMGTDTTPTDAAASALSVGAYEELFHAVCALETDMRRRDLLLHLALTLGGASALPVLRHLPSDDVDRLAYAIRTPGGLDSPAVVAIEKLTTQCWRLDETLGSRKILPVADAQLNMVERLLVDPTLTTGRQKQLLTAHWHLAHLAGWAHHDVLDHIGAAHRYQRGLNSAHQLGDPIALSHLHGALARLALFQHHQNLALDHTYAARGWANKTNSALQKAATAVAAARTVAAAERNPASLRMLDQAATLSDGKRTEADPLHLYWCTPNRTAYSRSYCLIHLGRTDEAIAASEDTLGKLSPSLARLRSTLMLETTPALIRRREIPAATHTINTAAQTAAGSKSAVVAEMVRQSRACLEPWAKTRHVRELDENLKVLGLAS